MPEIIATLFVDAPKKGCAYLVLLPLEEVCYQLGYGSLDISVEVPTLTESIPLQLPLGKGESNLLFSLIIGRDSITLLQKEGLGEFYKDRLDEVIFNNFSAKRRAVSIPIQ